MTVASILELIHGYAIERVSSVVDNLVALLQRGRVFIDFSTSDQEQLITWCLNVHKVVLKGEGDVDCPFVNCFGVQLIFVHIF